MIKEPRGEKVFLDWADLGGGKSLGNLEKLFAEVRMAEQMAAKHGHPSLMSKEYLKAFNSPQSINLFVLRQLIRFSDSLKPVSFEEEELVFDRLLLRTSRNYRLTRQMAREFDFSLVPQLIHTRRAHMEFNCFQTRVRYTPQYSEYRALVQDDERLADRLERFRILMSFNSSTYHDLNQMILSRLFRPSNSTLSRQEQKLYHYLLESVTELRDVDISEELSECGILLMRMSIIYSAITELRPFTPVRHSIDAFRSAVIAFYIQMRDGTVGARDLPALFMKNKKVWTYHPLHFINPYFADKISPDWMKIHHRALMPKKWPDPPARFKNRIFKFKILSPEKLLRDDILMSDIRQWYLELFKLPRVQSL